MIDLEKCRSDDPEIAELYCNLLWKTSSLHFADIKQLMEGYYDVTEVKGYIKINYSLINSMKKYQTQFNIAMQKLQREFEYNIWYGTSKGHK